MEQEKALERLNSSIQVIVDRIGEIDESATKVKQFAIGAEEKANQGKSQMDTMLEAMNDIYADMQEIINISHMIEDNPAKSLPDCPEIPGEIVRHFLGIIPF